MEAAAPMIDMSRSARDCHASGNNSADSVIAVRMEAAMPVTMVMPPEL
jgi:hypothetical protein